MHRARGPTSRVGGSRSRDAGDRTGVLRCRIRAAQPCGSRQSPPSLGDDCAVFPPGKRADPGADSSPFSALSLPPPCPSAGAWGRPSYTRLWLYVISACSVHVCPLAEATVIYKVAALAHQTGREAPFPTVINAVAAAARAHVTFFIRCTSLPAPLASRSPPVCACSVPVSSFHGHPRADPRSLPAFLVNPRHGLLFYWLLSPALISLTLFFFS